MLALLKVEGAGSKRAVRLKVSINQQLYVSIHKKKVHIRTLRKPELVCGAFVVVGGDVGGVVSVGVAAVGGGGCGGYFVALEDIKPRFFLRWTYAATIYGTYGWQQ